MTEMLTAYLWALLLASLLATSLLASKVSSSEFKLRLAAYFALYNVACILIRFISPSREAAIALNWMNPLLGLTAVIIRPIDAAVHADNPAVRIAFRATATLIGSTAIWVGLGWMLGGMLDARLES